MKRYESSYNPAVKDISDYIHDNAFRQGLHPVMATKIKNVLDGVEVTDNLLVQKEQLLGQKDNQLNQFQQIITTKTSEIQNKNSLLTQKEQLLSELRIKVENQLKEEYISVLHQLHPHAYPVNYEDWPKHIKARKLLDSGNLQAIEKNLVVYRELLKKELARQKEEVQNKDHLLSELKIKEENQLKEEYISVLHQLNPKVYSANYEDWSGKAQGAKNLIDQGNFTKIKKNLVGNKEQLAQKIETEKLALAAKEAEKLDKAKEEAVSILHQLHPHAYPVNYDDWPKHIKARKLLDSVNLQAIEKNLVVYRELLKKELARQKEEVQNKDQLILQKEQDLKILNDTFTTTISIKEEEIITKNQLLAQEVQSKNQLVLEKEMEEKLRIEKEQEIERLKELITQKEIETQELLARKENELLAQKEVELVNKSLVKNQVIGDLQDDIDLKEKEAYKLQIELLMKQVEFHKKESELKDKILEDACAINDLQGQLVALKALYGHDVSFAEEFSAIQFRAENSIANNDFDDIADLSRYISRLVEAERDNSEPMSLATLMALNESPINHGEEQPIYRSIYIEDRSVQPGSSLLERQMESLNISSIGRQNQVVQTGGSLIAGEQMPVPLNQGNIMNHGAQNQNLIGNIIGNFDNQHITHSIALGGETSESFSIIDAENSH